METHPSYKFTLYSGSAYINNDRHQGQNIPNGYLSLYEYNVDRARVTAPGANKVNDSLINPYVVRDGNWLAFESVSTSSYAAALPGTILSTSYPLTSSIRRQYLPSRVWPFPNGTDNEKTEFVVNRKNLMSLKNTMNYYRYISDKYEYSSFYVSGTVNMIEIPSIFYGSSIAKGSVSLKFYFTGSLVDELIDSRQNGELISTRGALSGTTVGVVLYNEGFMLLTGSGDIGNATTADDYLANGIQTQAKWTYFGAYNQASISGSTGGYASASLFSVNFLGTQKIPTMTMFATAKKGEVNNSLNPTWISSSNGNWRANVLTGSGGYIEPRQLAITNTINNQYCEYDSPFEKQTFISEIGIFDEHKNLIGIAKLANPVMKKESQDFTFKLKLDM
tara:strand:+ start:318 stop:1490 length:1173 start_codon:yes stop_codon:yes gene_type:complete